MQRKPSLGSLFSFLSCVCIWNSFASSEFPIKQVGVLRWGRQRGGVPLYAIPVRPDQNRSWKLRGLKWFWNGAIPDSRNLLKRRGFTQLTSRLINHGLMIVLAKSLESSKVTVWTLRSIEVRVIRGNRRGSEAICKIQLEDKSLVYSWETTWEDGSTVVCWEMRFDNERVGRERTSARRWRPTDNHVSAGEKVRRREEIQGQIRD